MKVNGLYHKEIGFPDVELPTGVYELKKYSRHALNAAQDDRYGVAKRLPTHIDMSKAYLFEIEVKDNQVVKAAVRTHYDDKLDLIVVFLPQTPDNFVKTVWFNEKIDRHRTLQHWRYDVPPRSDF